MFDNKEIFTFHDGYKERCCDPLVALRRLHSVPGFNLEYDQKLIIANQPPECYEALGRFVQAARNAFSLPPFEEQTGEGVTESKCLQIMGEFSTWMSEQKKSTNGPVILPAGELTSCRTFQPKKDIKPPSDAGLIAADLK